MKISAACNVRTFLALQVGQLLVKSPHALHQALIVGRPQHCIAISTHKNDGSEDALAV